jgi:hypothetical protein
MVMSSSNKVELLTAHVVAQIRHNRAPLGHCWQNIRHGPADYCGVLRLSAPLINTLSHVLSPHSHDLIPIHNTKHTFSRTVFNRFSSRLFSNFGFSLSTINDQVFSTKAAR